MRRVSIRTLMAAVIVSAIGLAALRNANELWAEIMLVAAFVAVGVAVLGAVILRGREQAWWLGFALFSGVYLVFVLAPLLLPQIGTMHFLDHLRRAMFSSAGQVMLDTEVESLLLGERNIKATLAHSRAIARNANDPAVVAWTKQLQKTQGQLTANRNAGPRPEHFRSVGNALLALFLGLVGGTVGGWFYARRERAEVVAGGGSSPMVSAVSESAL